MITLAIVRADLDASTKKLKEVEQKIVDLEKALRIAWEEERQRKGDVKAQYTLIEAAKKEFDGKSKVLANFEMVPTLLLDDAKELERHEQIMLVTQSSLNLDAWMDTD